MITTADAVQAVEDSEAGAGAAGRQVAGVAATVGTMARVKVGAASGKPHHGHLASTCCHLHSARKQSSSAGERRAVC
jgi:hypothetical protein